MARVRRPISRPDWSVTTGVQALSFTGPDYNAVFASAEEQIEAVNIEMASYAELVSPTTKLRTTAAFSRGGASVWKKLSQPQSSPEIKDNNVIVGCFSMMTFLFWGPLDRNLGQSIHLGRSEQG